MLAHHTARPLTLDKPRRSVHHLCRSDFLGRGIVNEEEWRQKKRHRSSLVFGGKKLFNSVPR